ncbi:MAG: PAS domain S-box protein, partial [Thermodesulfobacteriota bacterium]
LLVENANEAIFVIQDGMLRFFNIKNIELIGYSKEELTSTPFINFVHPDDREVTLGRYLKRIRGEELPGVNVFRIIDKAGNIKWAEVNSVLISWEGRPAILNFLNDITERKRAEEALRESEQRYRNLVENAPDVIFTLAPDGTITSLNPAFETITGWSRSEWLGKAFTAILRPDDLSRGLEFFRSVLKGEKTAPFELGVLGESGDYLTAEFTVTPQTHDGSVMGVLGIARDITDRKRIEEALQMTQFSVEHAPESVLWINSKGQLDYANEVACRALGYSREELVSMFLWDIDPDFDRERWSTHWQGLPKRGPSTLESHHRTKEGKIFPVEITGDYLKYREKEYNVAFVRDITERKRAEDSLRESVEALRAFLNANPEVSFLMDAKGTVLVANESLLKTGSF